MKYEQAGLVATRVPLRQRFSSLLLPGWRGALVTISMLGVATALGAVMVFLTQTLLARELGPEAYGLFASSLATVTMIAPLAGFGLTQFRLRVYGVEGWGAHRWLKPSLRFSLVTATLAMGLVFAWALSVAPDAQTRFALLVLSPVVLSVFAIELLSNRFRLEDRYGAMALWQMAIPASRLVVALVLLLVPHLTGRFVALAYGAISLLLALSSIPLLRGLVTGDIDLRGHGPRTAAVPMPAPQLPRVREVWAQAWPYGMVAVLYPVFFQVSTILLKYLGSDAQAGKYSIALAVMSAIYLIPATIYQKFLLSKLHRWAAHDVPKFWAVYRRGNVGMLLLGAVIGIGVVVASPWVVPLLFGERYTRVTAILLVLALCPPIRFLSTSMGSALLTDGHMRYRVYAMGGATLVAIGLNVVLIPLWGEIGAAWATVAAETALLVGTWYGVRRFHAARHAGPGTVAESVPDEPPQ